MNIFYKVINIFNPFILKISSLIKEIKTKTSNSIENHSNSNHKPQMESKRVYSWV